MSIQIKKVAAKEILPVRQPVLRPGKKTEECRFDGDEDKATFHLALFEAGRMVAIASFMKNKKAEFTEENQYQLRGMAVLPEAQQKQYGKKLIEKGIEFLKAENIRILWCNARKTAVGFYDKQGFLISGSEFLVPEIGLHFLMYKKI